MTKSEATKVFRHLSDYYPNIQNIGQHTIKLWVSNLLQFPYDDGFLAATRLGDSSKWFPSWSEFLAMLKSGDMPSPEEAWGIALLARGSTTNENPAIARANEAVGGPFSFQRSSDPHKLRSTWISCYMAETEKLSEIKLLELKEKSQLQLTTGVSKPIEILGPTQ